jgi:transposase
MKIAFPTLVPYWSDGIESLSMEKSLYAQGRPEQVQLHFDLTNLTLIDTMAAILGIDISKAKFDVVLLHQGKQRHKVFCNTLDGFSKLQAWLIKQQVSQLHACMEVTGVYGENLAMYLHNAGYTVSMVNPARIKAFGISQLTRNKTDKVDAQVIALFCQTLVPDAWSPLPVEVQELQALVRRLDALMQMHQQEMTRLLSGAHPRAVLTSIQNVIAHLDQEIKTLKAAIEQHISQHSGLQQQQELIASIPGIGALTAAKILAEIPQLKSFSSARQAAAFAGLTPKQRISGSSVRGRTHLSKMGSARVRKALYMPAVASLKWNPLIQELYQRLRQRGKHSMAALGAVMRKLLHLIYGVLKSGKPFSLDYGMQAKLLPALE